MSHLIDGKTTSIMECRDEACIAVVRGPLDNPFGWRRQCYNHDVEMITELDPNYVPPYGPPS